MSIFLYNPHLQSTESIVEGFVVRHDLLERVVEDLKARQPQHTLFIGQRGMGKTTLLRRIAAEIERDPDLSSRWLALRFPEEQYNVATLSDFYLNCLDALADTLERLGDHEEVARIERFVSDQPAREEDRVLAAREKLLQYAHGPRGLVLCVDNLQQVLGRLSKEQWTLRKLLGEEERFVVIGASPAGLSQDYGAAFYDFFQAHWLRSLSLEQTREMLLSLSRRQQVKTVEDAILTHPGRVGAMRILTGGNPRIVTLLYQVMVQSPGADVRGQLDALLDQITPLYKARFEELAEQAQLVLDALAFHWNPATAADIAERTHLEVTTVSTQLHRLHEEALVDKVDIPDTPRQGFQVSDRFFNLWYLMRASRRLRGRLLALAQSLEALYETRALNPFVSPLAPPPEDVSLSGILAHDQSIWQMAPFRPPTSPLDHLDTLLSFLTGLIAANRIPDAVAFVAPFEERYPPLFAALRAVQGQNAGLVRQYAPEIAEPALKILDVIWPENVRPAVQIKKSKKKR